MTASQTLARLEALCQQGLSFELALREVGLADTPLATSAMLFRYWKFLEMEHAYNAAKVFYDRYLELEHTR
jgi:hypothetical protein